MRERQVWVTGLGAVTAAGVGTGALLAAAREGRSGVRPLAELDGAPGGRVDAVPRGPGARRLDRSGALFLAAAEEAWASAGFHHRTAGGLRRERCGLCEGSSLGPLPEAAETVRMAGDRRRRPIRPSGLVRFLTGAGGATFAQAHGFEGPVLHVSAGSVSALAAIGEARGWIAAGRAEVVVAGGAEAPLQADVLAHFRAAGLLAEGQDPRPCRPFDADRSGTVLGEGAGVVVLEAASHARRRGAVPRAVVRGYGFRAEPYSMVAPDPMGAAVAAAAGDALGAERREGRGGARAPAGRGPGWIKAHGAGTRAGDAAELRGLAAVLGPDLAEIPVAALKPLLGHCLGASGAVETVAAVLALEAGIVPATLGTRRVDPGLPACRVCAETQETEAGSVLLLSEGFGGRCTALLLTGP